MSQVHGDIGSRVGGLIGNQRKFAGAYKNDGSVFSSCKITVRTYVRTYVRMQTTPTHISLIFDPAHAQW